MAGKRGDKGLTLKQEAFCRAYIENGGNASAAYRASYDCQNTKEAVVNVKASELLRHGKVSVRIAEEQAKIAQKHGVTVDRIVGGLAKIGFCDVRKAVKWNAAGAVELIDSDQLDGDTAFAISEVSQGPNGTRIKFNDKRAALVDLGKHLGMFKDIVEHSGKGGGPVQVEAINDVESARRIAYALGKAIGKQQAQQASAPAAEEQAA